MGKLIATFFMTISFFSILYINFTQELQQQGYRKITYAFEHAIHDAALFVKKEALAEGIIDFDEPQSLAAFKNTLQKNLPLDDTLSSTNPYVIDGGIEIVDGFPIYIDDNYEDPVTGTTVSFPYLFTYNGVEHWVAGPSVVYAIQVKAFKSDEPVTKLKIQEYKKKWLKSPEDNDYN